MQKNPLRYHAHLDTKIATEIVEWFIAGTSASDLAQQLLLRKATILSRYTHFRKQLFTHVQAHLPSIPSSGYLRLRRKQYPHHWQKNELIHKIYISLTDNELRARCVSDLDSLAVLPTKELQQELVNNYYIHHKKFVDEILPLSTPGEQKTFFGMIPEEVISFVDYAKEIIHRAHGIPAKQFPLHVAERVVRWQRSDQISELLQTYSS